MRRPVDGRPQTTSRVCALSSAAGIAHARRERRRPLPPPNTPKRAEKQSSFLGIFESHRIPYSRQFVRPYLCARPMRLRRPVGPFRLLGKVVEGFKRGSKARGWPTANLDPAAFEHNLDASEEGVRRRQPHRCHTDVTPCTALHCAQTPRPVRRLAAMLPLHAQSAA